MGTSQPLAGEPIPCPYCASVDLEYIKPGTHGYPHAGYVYCDSCGTHGPSATSRAAAIAAWNRRAWQPKAKDSDKPESESAPCFTNSEWRLIAREWPPDGVTFLVRLEDGRELHARTDEVEHNGTKYPVIRLGIPASHERSAAAVYWKPIDP